MAQPNAVGAPGAPVRDILGEARSVRELLAGKKYAIDYYQRDYKWQEKQVTELLDDLSAKFLDHFDKVHDRTEVEKYGQYFLGSIIVSRKGGKSFVIDGQQRLTTLTLLLIHLHNLQRDRKDAVKVDDLIYSEKYSRRSFNIEVEEREACMEALFKQADFDENGQSESVRNIAQRYRDIEDNFAGELADEALPYFVDWLLDNVHLVEITAFSDEDAYTIFETMNDRGLSLSPTDMLKGYLLASITDEKERLAANKVWREVITTCQVLGKDEDADVLKAWLRARYAQTIRDRKRGAAPGDFDRIGSEFHRWVRDNAKPIGLAGSKDFSAFIREDFTFYAKHYLRLRIASVEYTAGLEDVFHLGYHVFTLAFPVLLAPLNRGDSETVIDQKVRVTAAFLDILLARRLWNFRSIAHSTMQYAMFVVMKEIRGKDVAELARLLKKRLEADEETFASNDRLSLHKQNRWPIHFLLARIADYLETASGQPARFDEFVQEGKNRYEIEHVWADHPEWFKDEFPHRADFEEARNSIGGLLLLPKSFNASFGDLPYEKKLPHYFGQNLLAKSLHRDCYARNPGFARFVKDSGLPFGPHSSFRMADLEARQKLYRQLAEQIWKPGRLDSSSEP